MQDSKQKALRVSALLFTTLGYTAELETDLGGNAEFGPSSTADWISRVITEHPGARLLLPLAPNGLVAVRASGGDADGALRAVSRGDVPRTIAVRDGDGSVTLLFQTPHGVDYGGLEERTLTVSESGATVEFLLGESCIVLPPGGEGDDACGFETPDDGTATVADAPSWVIASTDHGPLSLGGVSVARPTHEVTGADLERIGFYSSKGETMDRLDANRFVEYLTGLVKFKRTEADDFYAYAAGQWRKIEEYRLDVFLRELIQAYRPGFWTPALNGRIRQTLRVAVPVFDPSAEPRWGVSLLPGVLNLETFELLPHHDRYGFTVQVPIAYDPEADCPRFRQFLAEIFEDDAERVSTIQEFMGYCLTAETRAEKALALLGLGANGKSVWLRVLRALCGPMNVSSLSLANLQGRFNSFALVGKLVNISAENELRGSLGTELFKLIVTGEPIEVEKKFKQSFTFTPYCKLVMAMNSLPRTDDTTAGFSRRLLIVPCRRVFAPEEQNRHLSDELLDELPGILNFALEGLKRLRAQDFVFTESPVSNEMWQDYRLMLNPYLAFAEERLVSFHSARVSRKELREAFGRWCRRNGHPGLANENQRRVLMGLRDALVERGIAFEERISNGLRSFVHVTLTDEPGEPGAWDEEDR